MTERLATCSCGQLSARCAAEPVLVSLCSCRDCQRRTGSAFGVAAFFEASAVTLSGRYSTYRRGSDSGYGVAFGFCPDCGTSVFWRPQRKPDIVAVALGCFADPDFPGPSQAVYGAHMPAWSHVTLR